jgi:predicted permease
MLGPQRAVEQVKLIAAINSSAASELKSGAKVIQLLVNYPLVHPSVSLMFLDTVLQDVRYGARVLRRNPGFTAVAVFALAIGIGVNTAAFTAYKAMVARPVHAHEPERMVNMALVRQSGVEDFQFSYPEYETYRDSMRSFSGVVAENHELLRLTDAGGLVSSRSAVAGSLMGKLGLLASAPGYTEFAMTFMVTENYFRVFGNAEIRGRGFDGMTAAEMFASPPALISDNYWEKRFRRDPGVIGKTIRLNDVAFTVTGITPRNFIGHFVAVPDFWIPLTLAPLVQHDEKWLRNPANECCRLLARLAPGATIAQAEAEMNSVTNHLLEGRGSQDPVTASVWLASPFPRKIDAGLRLAVFLVMLAVGLVLVVACANVACLQLARATSRRNELSIRLSLGAGGLRLVRQLVTESVLMAVLAGAVALLITQALLRIGVTMAADAMPAEYGTLIFYVDPDLQIFAYVLGISVLAGVLFGLAPALESARSTLRAHRGTSVRGKRLQKTLIATQVAVATVLMVAGSLLVRSSIQSLASDAGYDSKRVVRLDLKFPDWLKYTPERKATVVEQLRQRLAALPGVEKVTSGRAPNEPMGPSAFVSLNGDMPTAQNQHAAVCYSRVQSNYFETLGLPFVSGARPDASPTKVVLSQSAAQRLWPGQNPVGRTLRLGTNVDPSVNGASYEVVGVVRDAAGYRLDGSDSRTVYLPMQEDRVSSYPILVRTHGHPSEQIQRFDELIAGVDPDVLAYTATLDEMYRHGVRFVLSSLSAAVASTIGLLGLLLACMGLFGTVHFIVALRTREIGIRIAIGARKRHILALLMGESLRPVAAGLAGGTVLSLSVYALLRALLNGIQLVDAVAFGGVALLFLAMAVLAALPPSRRAMRVDPMVALRYE